MGEDFLKRETSMCTSRPSETTARELCLNSSTSRECGKVDIVFSYQDSSFPVNCVVYDSFLPWALDVAKENGIYGASFFTNSATVCAIFCRIHRGLISLPVKPDETPLLLPGLPPLNLPDLPSFVLAPESHPAYLAMNLRQYSNAEKADWVFGNTFEKLEGQCKELIYVFYDSLKAAKVVWDLWPAKLIGPMVPSAFLDGRIKGDKGYGASLWNPLGSETIQWLETKPWESVVYVSFGSMVSLAAEQMEEVASGLKCSDLDFIWVVRESELGKLPPEFADLTKEKNDTHPSTSLHSDTHPSTSLPSDRRAPTDEPQSPTTHHLSHALSLTSERPTPRCPTSLSPSTPTDEPSRRRLSTACRRRRSPLSVAYYWKGRSNHGQLGKIESPT
ncbi:hypothetical protein RHGRI_033545 [Rhododendron griersonianum]|uniref:Uncharacterized protein n=1 Tax=Rhododendron griersonianum TaxID=479676 RepID=A0AAV6I2R1_9ERIC|nr:hypothetical protein RHGRI_033545 [Rhododendron griersonianum]